MRYNFFPFLLDVRNEMRKITWPKQREILLTTAMVFVFVIITSIFFFFVDFLIRSGLKHILTLFS